MKRDMLTEISIASSLLRAREQITRCKLVIREAEATIKANQILLAEYESQQAGWEEALDWHNTIKEPK